MNGKRPVMFRILSLFLALIMIASCSNTSQMANSTNFNSTDSSKPNDFVQETVGSCDFNDSDLKEKLKNLFNSEGIDTETYKPEEDKNLILIREIKSCPREEIIKSILTFQSLNKDSIEMNVKSSYLLIKLEHNKNDNGKTMVEAYSVWLNNILERRKDKNYEYNVENNKYDTRFGGEKILGLISDVITNDDKELLSDTFNLVSEVDGSAAELLSVVFGDEFDKNPEAFLRRLKPKSAKIREQVYSLVLFDSNKEDIIKRLSQIPKSSDVYSMSKDMLLVAKLN